MVCHEKYMQELVYYAREKNPIWPFAASIVDADGTVLVIACNATHLSPTFHGEMMAINAFYDKYKGHSKTRLTLYTTGECCLMCWGAVHWTNIMHNSIDTVVFGTTLKTMNDLWAHDVNMTSANIIEKMGCRINLIGPILEDECNDLFLKAKMMQETIDKYAPTWDRQSHKVADFWVCF